MNNILLINACVRDESRTKKLAMYVAQKLGGITEEADLKNMELMPLDKETLAMRDSAAASGDYSDDYFRYAKQLASADMIIVAAPYWDFSFPSSLKVYTENVSVSGLTFRYTEDGIPEGLCHAKQWFYVTTAGGFIGENNFGYDYINALFTGLFEMDEGIFIKAEGLDIIGADIQGIMKDAMNKTDTIFEGLLNKES